MESANHEVQPINETETEQTEDWKRLLLDIVETIILAVILYFGINALSARVRVDGLSMNPTLQNGEYVLVSKVSYNTSEPERGDIIVFKLPIDQQQDLIKRVIGLPGETISIQDGMVFVNGVQLNEPYIADTALYRGEWLVGEDQLFVLGDNRNDSKDSHQWGMLPFENIIGKAIVIYWPPADWKVVSHTEETFGTVMLSQDQVR